jgi:hypothetical protein
MHPYLSYELCRQRAADAARASASDPRKPIRPARTRRSSFALVRSTRGARICRRVRPEGSQP